MAHEHMINKFIVVVCCVCWLATLGTVMIIRIVKKKKVLLKVKSAIPVI